MTITSGVFRSVGGDRKYTADFFRSYFASFIGNGVFPNPSTNLQVFPGQGLSTQVRPGKAWISGAYMINDDNFVITHPNPNPSLSRIDRIIVGLNTETRTMDIYLKVGTPSNNPQPQPVLRTASVYELALADITIVPTTVSIQSNNIRDLRMNNDVCGLVTGLIQQVDTTSIFNQYQDALQQFETVQKQDFLQWSMDRRAEFDAWYADVQDVLSDDVAANLLQRINDLDDKTTVNLNKIQKIVDPTMSTSEIQSILNSSGDIKFENGVYNLSFQLDKTNPYIFDVQSNTNIYIEPNAFLSCPANSYPRHSFFLIDKKENVVINGGNLVGDRLNHIGSVGEWGFGVNINGSENVEIANMDIGDFWGDGIYIGAFEDGSSPSILPKNIKLKNITSNNNRRQGMSVVAVDNLSIENSVFSNTSGTLPSAGIDIEPNEGQIVRNVFINNCQIFGNAEEGILITLRQALQSAIIDNLKVKNTIINNNKYGIRTSNLSNKSISIESCIIYDNERGISLGITSNSSVLNNIIKNNSDSGISISTNSNANLIKGNQIIRNSNVGLNMLQANDNLIESNIISYNGTYGINIINNSSNNIVTNNSVLYNSQLADDTYSNIKLESTTRYNYVGSNIVRRGNNAMRPRYGIYFAGSSANNNSVVNNDCYAAGVSNSIYSPDSSNITGPGNRINDGTWSTTLI